MKMARRAAVAALVTVLACLAGANVTAAQEPPQALSSAEKQAVMLDVLDRLWSRRSRVRVPSLT